MTELENTLIHLVHASPRMTADARHRACLLLIRAIRFMAQDMRDGDRESLIQGLRAAPGAIEADERRRMRDAMMPAAIWDEDRWICTDCGGELDDEFDECDRCGPDRY